MSYLENFQGRFLGIIQMPDCENLFQILLNNPNNWYVYDTLKNPPKNTENSDIFLTKLKNIKQIIKNKHEEKYCGIVYVDSFKTPTFVKIFHPNNLGKSCGSSENPPIPQWLISKEKPVDVTENNKTKEQGFNLKFF